MACVAARRLRPLGTLCGPGSLGRLGTLGGSSASTVNVLQASGTEIGTLPAGRRTGIVGAGMGATATAAVAAAGTGAGISVDIGVGGE